MLSMAVFFLICSPVILCKYKNCQHSENFPTRIPLYSMKPQGKYLQYICIPVYIYQFIRCHIIQTNNIEVVFFSFVHSSCNYAVSGAETAFREQPGYAEEAGCQTNPETWPHLPEAPFGRLEVRLNANLFYSIGIYTVINKPSLCLPLFTLNELRLNQAGRRLNAWFYIWDFKVPERQPLTRSKPFHVPVEFSRHRRDSRRGGYGGGLRHSRRGGDRHRSVMDSVFTPA